MGERVYLSRLAEKKLSFKGPNIKGEKMVGS